VNKCGGGDDSLNAFYRPKGGQERGREGMCPTVMVDLQCVGFGAEVESGTEMVEGRGGDGACVLEEEGRGHVSVEGRQVGGATSAVRR
jgi:hypothetical protein